VWVSRRQVEAVMRAVFALLVATVLVSAKLEVLSVPVPVSLW